MLQCERNELTIDLGVLGVEPSDEYHAKAGEYLSSHQLLDFMACPWLYRKKHLGMINTEEDSPALLIGEATHCRILEGRDVYESRFALGGPINKSTGKPYGKDTKAFSQWAEAQGKPGIHYDYVDLIEELASGVAMNDEAVDLMLYGRAEGVVREDYCGMPCQIRIDWVHPHRGIIDLKTTRNVDWFKSDAEQRRYGNQLAFYRAVLALALGEAPERIPVYLVAVEKREPYRCGVWRLTDETLARAQRQNEEAIAALRRAWERDEFPTGYESIRLLDLAA